MPGTSRARAAEVFVAEGFEGRYEALDGGYTVGFERYDQDQDPGELFRGLPDGRCQSPHWGYVISGKLVMRYADREETYEAGDAYYAPPGHTPLLFAGTEVVEFSPTDALGETMAVVAENLAAAATP
jgi:hypothetical protein